MKIVLSPPNWGERARVRGVYFHGKKSENDLSCHSGEPRIGSGAGTGIQVSGVCDDLCIPRSSPGMTNSSIIFIHGGDKIAVS